VGRPPCRPSRGRSSNTKTRATHRARRPSSPSDRRRGHSIPDVAIWEAGARRLRLHCRALPPHEPGVELDVDSR
jgi:hypothetical protein